MRQVLIFFNNHHRPTQAQKGLQLASNNLTQTTEWNIDS